MSLVPVTIYFSVDNGGDGSAYPIFFLSKEKADKHQEGLTLYGGWGEPCTGEVETFIGSSTYKEAEENENDPEMMHDYNELNNIPNEDDDD